MEDLTKKLAIPTLRWKVCEVTGFHSVSIMNLKISLKCVCIANTFDSSIGEIYEGWISCTPITSWAYMGGGFENLEEIKGEALRIISKQLAALAHHVQALGNFEQI